MGTTRMHPDPRHGVVDENCRVHGTENFLHVAGSSVFPTGGWAPPTLTIVALAIRLADHPRDDHCRTPEGGMSARIQVRLVAPTLTILGGHAVQARRLIDAWSDDPFIQVRLVPISPPPPSWLSWLSGIKYARTAVTQCFYWPLLLRELRRLDVVHVFATSNSSFFLTALPAILVSRWFGKPVVVNYRGDGREHLARCTTARRALKTIDLNVVPSAYFHGVSDELGIPAR